MSDPIENISITRKVYFMECCADDLDRVAPIADKLRGLGITAEIGCNMTYVERIDKIKESDVAVFFLSKRLFQLKQSELYDDYQCCLDYGKQSLSVCLDNIDNINCSSLPSNIYAFWSKIRKIQGINLHKTFSDAKNAQEIIKAVEIPEQRSVQANKIKYVILFLIIAVALYFAINTLALKNPKPLSDFDSAEQLSAGQHVTFGLYEQDGNTANGSEPIEWIVLDKKSDKVLLISDKLLDYVQYNEQKVQVTWSDCSLRKWMNDDFMDEAFNESEQDKIALSQNINPANDEYKTTGGNSTLDNVFALSVNEVNEYFSSDKSMIAYTTEFARQKGYASSDGSDYWWLRSPGKSGEYAADVYESGGIVSVGNSVDLDTVAIRPAMWVQID